MNSRAWRCGVVVFVLLLSAPGPANGQPVDGSRARDTGLTAATAPPGAAGPQVTTPAPPVPVVVEPPTDIAEQERGALRVTDTPAPYSLAAFAAGASVVLLTLTALTKSRKRLPAPVPAYATMEREPVEPTPVPAIDRRRWDVLVERKPAAERILP